MPLSNIPSGLRYYLGTEARLRRSVEDTAMSVFAGWSYQEVITPSVDYYSLFEHGMGQAEARRSFRFTDNDGRLLSLRPDVTSSVARVAATLLVDQPRPLRLCYAAPVFRQQPQSHAEWRRENTQLGCELIGADGNQADLEILLVAAEILSRLNLRGSFCITINDVGVFNGLAAHLEIEGDAREQLRRLIDIRDGAGLQSYLKSIARFENDVDSVVALSHLTGKGAVLNTARQLITNKTSLEALNSLSELWRVIEQLNLQDCFEIDLADVSSLDYYTGLSLKVFVRGVGYRIGRGGRYDDLISNFGRSEPAVGFVLNLDALTEVIGRDSGGNSNEQQEISSVEGTELGAAFAEVLRRRAKNETVRIEVKH